MTKTIVNVFLSLTAIGSLLVCGWIILEKVERYDAVRLSSYKVGYMHGYYDNTPENLKEIVCGQYWTFYHEKAIRKLNYRLDKKKPNEIHICIDFDFELKYRSEK